MITPTKNEKTHAVEGMGSFQNGSAGQSLHSTQQTKKEALRLKINHAFINGKIRPTQLSVSWKNYSYRGPFFLPRLPHIAINHIPGRCIEMRWQLKWFDPQTNVGGVGAISLVAHVLKVSEDEAAWRLANWLATIYGGSVEGLLALQVTA
jgi:hypothetical protein